MRFLEKPHPPSPFDSSRSKYRAKLLVSRAFDRTGGFLNCAVRIGLFSGLEAAKPRKLMYKVWLSVATFEQIQAVDGLSTFVKRPPYMPLGVLIWLEFT